MIASGEVKSGGNIKTGAHSSPPPMPDIDMDDQMAAIRQALADAKNDADPGPMAEVRERPATAASRVPMRRRDNDVESADTPASWINRPIKSGGAARGQLVRSRCDVAGLRRSHVKRAKKHLRSEARRKKSGAFMTGFTLVTLVAVTMVGLYALHPQIIAASPEMAPAINEYVVTVDRYRAEVNERTGEWSGWFVERVGRLTNKEG